MSRQARNQHWISGQGVRVSQFLSLIVRKTKKKIEKAFLKTQKVFFEKSGLSLVGDYIAMFNS